jgi:ABC-2 type transport system ATP-binding protein
MDHVIDIKGLTVCYGSFTAVDGIDLSVGKGEVFGFLGPNGAGKTTTIRVLLDLLRPNAGKVLVLGEDVARGRAFCPGT